jgi:hypothetical protein
MNYCEKNVFLDKIRYKYFKQPITKVDIRVIDS